MCDVLTSEAFTFHIESESIARTVVEAISLSTSVYESLRRDCGCGPFLRSAKDISIHNSHICLGFVRCRESATFVVDEALSHLSIC
jgi:hypothetical protein